MHLKLLHDFAALNVKKNQRPRMGAPFGEGSFYYAVPLVFILLFYCKENSFCG